MYESPNTILITGGTGYIGSAVISRLVQNLKISKIISIDPVRENDNQYLERFIEEKELKKVILVKGDLLDEKMYDTYVPQCDVVIHLAAAVGERRCEEEFLKTIDRNIKLLAIILKKMKENNVKKLVWTSSEVVYGKNKKSLVKETAVKTPTSFYGHTKSFGEEMINYFSKKWGLETIILRLSRVYGFGVYAKWYSLTGKFTKLAVSGKDLPIRGDGRQKLNLIHVNDVAGCIHELVDKKGIWNETYNVSDGNPVSVNQLADEFIAASAKCGHKIKKIYSEPENIEDNKWGLDIRKIKKTGWSPQITLEEGIKTLIEAYIKEKSHQ